MRAGGCALQQALTTEAAGVVKQAVVLAKRRGHAQVTPLHVANTMLAGSSGLFRVACLESHSHPLQCKALELCFNVALNRLPASSSNPMLGPHSQQHPSISNALVAAFKRAQAHQRRGTIENQQQSLLAVKIELEQLIISILDDPSVSRVMREAGFSSTQVKTNVEKAVSLELCSQSSSPPTTTTTLKSKENNFLTLNHPSSPPTSQNDTAPETIRNEDVNIIFETLLMRRKRKSLVLVGECISNLESTVKGLMDRVDRGGVPDSLKEVKLITIPPLYSFCNLHREEVEQKIGEVTFLVKSLVGKGVVLYLGDLKWISDYRVSLEQERSYYCSVEHMIMELGRLVWGIGETERFWLMGIATFQTYMRCRTGYHSLETIWGLHPVTIPANSLGFSLVSDQSDEQFEARSYRRTENLSSSIAKNSCCGDCLAKLEAEERSLVASKEPTFSSLPFWLKDENTRLGNNDQKCEAVRELHKKWNTFCSSAHKQPELLQRTLTFSSAPTDQKNVPDSKSTWKDNQRWMFNLMHMQENGDSRSPFWSNPSSAPNSGSSSDIMDMEYTQKFKEFNAENLNILCNALEKKVPWQKEIIPEIAGTILQCRSGMLRRKDHLRGNAHVKEETWLLFIGPDEEQDREKISRELAKIVFGSYSSFMSIGIMERFAEAVSENPHRVFLVEDLEQADYCSKMAIKQAMERGRLSSENGEEIDFCDAIIILSSKQKNKEEKGDSVSLDLNMSFDDHDSVEDDVGILENVDRRLVFKIQDL